MIDFFSFAALKLRFLLCLGAKHFKKRSFPGTNPRGRGLWKGSCPRQHPLGPFCPVVGMTAPTPQAQGKPGSGKGEERGVGWWGVGSEAGRGCGGDGSGGWEG